MRRFLATLLCILILGLSAHGGRTFNGTSDLATAVNWPQNSLTSTGVATLTYSFVLNLVAYPTAGAFETIFQSAPNTTDSGTKLYDKIFLTNGTYGSCSTNQEWLVVDFNSFASSTDGGTGIQTPALGRHTYLFSHNVAGTQRAYVDGVAITPTVCTSSTFPGHSAISSSTNLSLSWMSNNGCPASCGGTAAQFVNGTLSDFSVWYLTGSGFSPTALNGDALMLANCATPGDTPVLGPPAAYWPMYASDASPLPMWPGQTAGTSIQKMTLTGTTAANQQTGCPYGAGR